MRNSMLVLAALASLTIFVLPAAAESDEGFCGAPSSVAPSGPIDLQAIPMLDASTPKAIKGGGDACDDQQGDEADDND
ncbi:MULTISPECIES: hypothetical protein [Mesorhizobium]|uniref:Uncharacterized protein n=1 Tax=Rhizobium loti TaxID=381 RepID=A0A6M7U0X4_RHILI|nr:MULTISPECIES: hypothetical protein [Mesorhizobium]KRB23144.1 hypothetical protein ASE05_10820 [Mesorhizobium sp. Root172]OBQ63198.1 hypothetical protein A8145_18930 [Mesorhizobium loti]QKC70246.1 hypothetical protein EB815_14700 [Mesorhizobium loti]QKC89224.1 hypothetical protein EB230_12870 [Mesorhizobium sp. NZP2234]